MVAAAPMLTVSAVLSPKKPVKRVARSEAAWRGADGGRGRAASEVLRVLRSDAEYTAPIRKAIGDIFWLRFLERKPESEAKWKYDVVVTPPAKQQDDVVVNVNPQSKPEIPVLSPYPPGLSCVDLMMADFEALKLYVNYFWQSSKVLSTPVPETYDPQVVADYFLCRPHVLGFRIIEILFAFLTASVKLRASKRTMLEPDVRFARIDTSFDGSKYYMGQLLKETLLYLGPTFIKVGQSLSTRPDIIGSEICEVRLYPICMIKFHHSQERRQWKL